MILNNKLDELHDLLVDQEEQIKGIIESLQDYLDTTNEIIEELKNAEG